MIVTAKENFTLKSDCRIEDFMMLHPNLLIIIATVLTYANENDLDVEFTSIISDRENVEAKSKTHEDGRAIDMSTKGWNDFHISRIISLLEDKHSDIAAISASDLQPRPAVYHNYNNQGDHLHLQVRANK